MMKLIVVLSSLVVPTFALSNSFEQSTNKGSFILFTLLCCFALASVTQIGFYLRHLLKQRDCN